MNSGPATINIEIKQFITRTILSFSFFHLVVNRNYICWIQLEEGETSLAFIFLDEFGPG